MAAVTPSAKPKFIQTEDGFWVKVHLLQQGPWIVVVSKHFSHGTAGRADAAFEAVLELFSVQNVCKSLFGNSGH